jgi:hypothetical protein
MKTTIFALILVLVATAAMAQTTNGGGGPVTPPQPPTIMPAQDYIPDTLKSALDLTYNQIQNINRVLGDFNNFAEGKNNKYWDLENQVSTLRTDTRRDPYAIAIALTPLIAEQIQIGRELDAASAKTHAQIWAVMNFGQIAILAKLQEVLRLQDLAWAAVNTHFVLPPQQPTQNVGAGRGMAETSVLGAFLRRPAPAARNK